MWPKNHKRIGFFEIGLMCFLVTGNVSATQAEHPAGEHSNMDFKTIKTRLFDYCRNRMNVNAGFIKKAKSYRDTLQSDGQWKIINYKNSTPSKWQVANHLRYLEAMAVALQASESTLRKNAKLKKSILLALDYWLEKDFKNSNWWWNEIGVPTAMFRILILMEAELTDTQRTKGINILRRSKIRMTGQNLVWLATINMARACLQGDAALMKKAIGGITKTIRITADEGIQADYSFYQHGKLLYSGGYGLAFSVDCAQTAYFVHHTAFAFSKEQVALLSKYILDGQQWMVRGKTFDYGAVGREISRKGRSARGLIRACEYMEKLQAPRLKEFQTLAANIKKNNGMKEKLIGNRHFWRSDFMVHHRPGYYASVRMHSKRIYNTDGTHNGEGLRSHHLADGVTYIFRDGQEYFDIFGAWNWRLLPGATIQNRPAGAVKRKGTKHFVGGVSDGQYGTACFDFERDGLTAKKSWFFFDDEFVCLGAGIKQIDSAPVYTALNQCLLRGPVSVSNGSADHVLASGTHPLTKVKWVHHDRVGYLFLETQAANIKIASHPVNWKRINKTYPAKEGTLDIFSLWIRHNTKPKRAAYQYVVIPDSSRKAMASYSANLPIKVIKNTTTLQAVTHLKLNITGVVFYKAGNIKLENGLQMSVDQACLVQLRWDKGKAILAVAKPPEGSKKSKGGVRKIHVNINRKLNGPNCIWNEKTKTTKISVTLPTKMNAGQSVIIKASISK